MRSLRRPAFTLAELMVATSVGVVVGGLVLAAVVAQVRQSAVVTAYADMAESNRYFVDTLAKDLRSGGSVALKSSDGSPASGAGGATGFVLTTTYTNEVETVSYVYKNRTLTRTSSAAGRRDRTTAALTGIDGIKFIGLDLNDQTVAAGVAPRKVGVLINGSRDLGGGRSVHDNFVSAVFLVRSVPR